MNEGVYQRRLIKKIQRMLPGCFIIKNDPSDTQGIPDLLILFNDKWGALEAKISDRAPRQPNQIYYIDTFNEMSFAAFISPENESEVLGDLKRVLG